MHAAQNLAHMTLCTPDDIAHLGPFYKLTNEEERHGDMQYSTGVHTDCLPFNPSGGCQPGGLYFFARHQLIHVGQHCGMDMHWIRPVTFTAKSQIWQERNKFKTNELVLGERERFWLPADLCLAAVQQDSDALQYVREQTPEIYRAAYPNEMRPILLLWKCVWLARMLVMIICRGVKYCTIRLQ